MTKIVSADGTVFQASALLDTDALHQLKALHAPQKAAFYLHLKECGFRVNSGHEGDAQTVLKAFRKQGLIPSGSLS